MKAKKKNVNPLAYIFVLLFAVYSVYSLISLQSSISAKEREAERLQAQIDQQKVYNTSVEDLLAAGVYGGATMSRKHSSAITLDAVAARKQGKKSRNALLLSAFPSASKLEGRYPYLKKYPYLLPVAWCSRILTYSGEARRSSDNRAADALKIGSERIELLKTYDIL